MARVTRLDRRVWLHGMAGLCTAGLAVMICATGVSPRAGLERWCSDHYSHTGTTVLFLERGMDVYRQPVSAHCLPSPGRRDWHHRQHRRVLSQKWDVNPIDLCLRKTRSGGRSKSRPLVINWQRFPRPYPPGVMLYFLPEALLWDHTGASFHTINRVSIVKLLVVGHLAWMVLVVLLAGLRPRGVAWVVIALGYSQLIYWSLVGIYDGVAILFLLLCMLALHRQRGSMAILALSAACFLHFRALWYLPLLVPGILLVIHKRELRSSLGGHGNRSAWWGRVRIPNPVVLLGAAALFAASAYVFWILWPALKSFPSRNPFDYRKFAMESPVFMSYLAPTVGVALLLAWRRLWLGLGLMVWMTVFFLRTPQIMTWHVLFMLPMLTLPALTAPAPSGCQDRRQEHSFGALVWYFVGAAIVFKATLWPAWIASVVKRLGA